MKRPWMPLYVADYLSKTSHLSAAESGAYLHLLMYYWTHGQLPDDEIAIARISRLTPRAWAKSRVHIKGFFLEHWKQPRMEQELAKVIDISSKRSASAKQMHYTSNANAHTLHTSHIQRKTVNGFEGSKKEEIGGFKARPGSPEFLAWSAWAIDTDKKIFSKELKQRELEGRPFDFETQWPPQHQNGI